MLNANQYNSINFLNLPQTPAPALEGDQETPKDDGERYEILKSNILHTHCTQTPIDGLHFIFPRSPQPTTDARRQLNFSADTPDKVTSIAWETVHHLI
jgi:hypothetical protein